MGTRTRPSETSRRPASPPDGDRDDRIVAEISARNEEALGRAYDCYGSLVYSLALRILRSPPSAEEVTQDVFLKLWNQAERFDPARGSLAGFLVTMTRNRAIDRVRARRGRPTCRRAPLDLLPRRSWSPLSRLSLAEARERVRAALPDLPSSEAEVLRLAYFEGLSQSQIAERTGAPLGTVKGRARNGLRRLADVLPADLGGGS